MMRILRTLAVLLLGMVALAACSGHGDTMAPSTSQTDSNTGHGGGGY